MLPWLPNLSALRVVRVLRETSIFARLRRLTDAIRMALPRIASLRVMQAACRYVAAVRVTRLGGRRFDEWFVSVGCSMEALFQSTTLES